MQARRIIRSFPKMATLLCAGALGLLPALAQARHTHREPQLAHSYIPDNNSGFGPTAPGPSEILVDAATGTVLNARGADIPRYPASLTKLMVLDLAFEALRDGQMTLDTEIPVSPHAAAVEPVKLGLRPGDRISVRQAILAMTTMSANDAATALGEYLGGGSEVRCAVLMTLRAHALGMAQTQFSNASGLPNPNQVTTARDLAILARDIVIHDSAYQSFFEVQKFDFYGHTIYSNNEMLKTYPGATGMKTGYTNLARHNLVISAARNGRVLIGVALHEPSWGTAYEQETAMLNAGFGAPAATYAQAAPAPALPAAIQPARGTYIAELGPYDRLSRARRAALSARDLRGQGIARIARVERHGHILYAAQLAGLTWSAAHATCHLAAARGDNCLVIGPTADNVANRADSSAKA